MLSHRQKNPYDIIVVIEFLLGIIFLLYYFICAKIYGTKVSILYLWLITGGVMVMKSVSVWLSRQKCGRGFKVLSKGFDIYVGVLILVILTFSVSMVDAVLGNY